MQFTAEQLEKLNKKYDKIGLIYDRRAKVQKGDKYGFISETGELVIPCIFDNELPFANGYAIVYKDGFYGAIDTHGNFVVDCIYKYFTEVEMGLKKILEAKYGEHLSVLDSDDRI